MSVNLEQNDVKIDNKNIDEKEKEIKNENKIETSKAKFYFGHSEDADIWNSFLTDKMFAHRGLVDNDYPENSLSAFKKAIDKNYGIELDVNPIENGTPVVFHDSKMSRMTGKDKYIQNLSKEEFESTTLINSSEKIPTLQEVLALVDGKVPLLIEIKHQQKIGELEKRVLELLKNYKGEYAIQSFDPFTLEWFYKNAPKIWRGQLSGFFKGERLGLLKKLVLKSLGMKKITHQNFVNYDIKYLPNMWTKRLTIPLLTYTITSEQQYLRAVQVADNVVFQGFEPTI